MTILDSYRADLTRLMQQEATLLKDRSRHEAAAMSDSIDDAAATVFAGKFYGAIASAQPVSKAIEQGKV